ncbi:MAG: hypothetical protein SH848_11020 [Saprospiraceae bacterium]|nr:hypothetical protein [Saprospiraceae bacterium]MDZ4704452.1 hypothetical protein [Saprospiraceae bacterium]
MKQLHHLYGIFEKDTDDVFKYGISDDPMGEDGLSNRVRAQVRFANLAAGFLKFFAKILMFNIPGRAKAEEIEREHIEVYRQKNGQKPSGNLR